MSCPEEKKLITEWNGKDFNNLTKTNMNKETRNIICEMFDRWMIAFEPTKLKSGKISPIYINLRRLPSYPMLMESIAKELLRKVHSENVLGTRFAGLPMSGFPIAVAMGLIGKIPVMYPRQSSEQGTRQSSEQGKAKVEGDYKEGDFVIVVDDVLTDGQIKHSQIQTIKQSGLNVRNLVVVVDREEGGTTLMEQDGIRVHSMMTLKEIVQVLREDADLSDHCYEEVMSWITGRAE